MAIDEISFQNRSISGEFSSTAHRFPELLTCDRKITTMACHQLRPIPIRLCQEVISNVSPYNSIDASWDVPSLASSSQTTDRNKRSHNSTSAMLHRISLRKAFGH